MTYLLLDLAFLVVPLALAVAAVLVLRGAARRTALAAAGVALAVVLVLTAVFDNVILTLGIVAYDESHLSGVRLGLAPLEDFAYALAAGIGLPALWVLLPARRKA
ncbi:MAG: lycopene cyclase [Naasia sp.]|jgi:lycopene cyclase domain-containing protein|nr:lycopene cyclase [Naasia sp.]